MVVVPKYLFILKVKIMKTDKPNINIFYEGRIYIGYNEDTDYDIGGEGTSYFDPYMRSLKSYEVVGINSFKNYQEVIEGRDFKLEAANSTIPEIIKGLYDWFDVAIQINNNNNTSLSQKP